MKTDLKMDVLMTPGSLLILKPDEADKCKKSALEHFETLTKEQLVKHLSNMSVCFYDRNLFLAENFIEDATIVGSTPEGSIH